MEAINVRYQKGDMEEIAQECKALPSSHTVLVQYRLNVQMLHFFGSQHWSDICLISDRHWRLSLYWPYTENQYMPKEYRTNARNIGPTLRILGQHFWFRSDIGGYVSYLDEATVISYILTYFYSHWERIQASKLLRKCSKDHRWRTIQQHLTRRSFLFREMVG